MIELRMRNALALLTLFSVISCGDKSEQQIHASNTLKIATWNIEHLRADEGVGFRPRNVHDYEQLASIARELNADVIALQEVEDKEAVSKVFPTSEYQFFVSTRQDRFGAPIRTGFAVRKDLKVWENGEYQYLDVGGRGDLRYGLDITVEIGNKRLRLLSVHLKSQCFESSDPSVSSDCTVRLKQTEPLENWIDKRAIEDDTFIVLGDFNRRYDIQGEGEWQDIDDQNPSGADLMRVTEGRRQHCNDGKYQSFIDHIVFGTKASELMIEDSFDELTFDNVLSSDGKPPSDHCPQSVILSLE